MAPRDGQRRPMLSGHRIGSPHSIIDGERRLLVAVILRAVEEAERGDAEAERWLATTGRQWCEQILGLAATARVMRTAEARKYLATDPDALARRRQWHNRLASERSYQHLMSGEDDEGEEAAEAGLSAQLCQNRQRGCN